MPLILDNAQFGLKIPLVSLNISLARQLSALNSKGSSYRRLRFILTRTRSAVLSVRKLGGLKQNNILVFVLQIKYSERHLIFS